MPSAPTYPLDLVRRLAAMPGARRITAKAQQTALAELGMDVADVYAVVAALSSSTFFKTMASKTLLGMSQDVYRPRVQCPAYPNGIGVYCKVQVSDGRLMVVISFKRR